MTSLSSARNLFAAMSPFGREWASSRVIPLPVSRIGSSLVEKSFFASSKCAFISCENGSSPSARTS